MLELDPGNVFLALWLKPMLLLAALASLARTSYPHHAHASHWLLHSGLLCFTFGALLSLWAPHWQWNILPAAWGAMRDWVDPHNFLLTALWRNPIGLALAGYCFGVVWYLCYQGLALREVIQLTRRAEPAQGEGLKAAHRRIERQYRQPIRARVRVSRGIESPFMWGVGVPVVVLPAAYIHWPADRLLRVLAHEYAHIARGDWLAKLLANIACAIFWFVPLVWVVARKADWYAELACDDRVIAHFNCRAQYAEDLLELSAEAKHHGVTLAYNNDMALYARIQAVLDGARARHDLRPWQKARDVSLCVALLLILASFHLGFAAEKSTARFIPVNPAEYVAEGPNPQTWRDVPAAANFDQLRALASRVQSAPRRSEEMVISQPRALVGESLLAADISTDRTVDIRQPAVNSIGLLPGYMVMPSYPPTALRDGVEGRVRVVFDIDEFGGVVNARVLEAKPARVFEQAVLRAVARAKFSPGAVGGHAITTKDVVQTFVFQLGTTDKRTD